MEGVMFVFVGKLAGLDTLPPKLLARVCFYLDAGDVLRLGAACRSLREAASSKEVWTTLSLRDLSAALSPAASHRGSASLPGSKKLYFHARCGVKCRLGFVSLARAYTK